MGNKPTNHSYPFPVGGAGFASNEDDVVEEMSEQEQVLRDFYVDCKYCLYKYDFHC